MVKAKDTTGVRIHFLFFIVVVCASVLIGRLYSVQIVSGEKFSNLAHGQYVRPNSNIRNRGTIYFSAKDDKHFLAAVQKNGFTLTMNPGVLENPEEAYQKLSEVVSLDKEAFFAKSEKKDDPYEELLDELEPEVGEKVADLKIKGIQVFPEKWRYYPNEEMAAQTVGLVAYREDTLAGRYGLEKYYEDILNREDDSTYVNFFAEIFSNIKKTLADDGTRDADIITTIEPTVQSFLERTIREVNDRWHSDYTGGIVIDPVTGAVYSMAFYPTFNPNVPEEQESSAAFSNPLVEDAYEMGSIIKALTMAVGLDTGAVTPHTTYEDTGFLVLNGSRISNYDGRARGVVDMQEVLNQSLNTGSAFVARTVGKETFSKYFFDLGLAEKTNIDLPYESVNIVDNLNSPRDIEHATASYGQGIALTPITTARALSTLANGGYLVKPYLVKEIDYETGFSDTISPEIIRQVFSEKTSEAITQMLVTVVDDALANGDVSLVNYSIAAKTGTAQVPKEDGAGYHSDKYLHSFFGYFPAYKPRFLVFLYTVNPKGVLYASHTLTDPFMSMTKFLINYYEIPPDR